MPPECRCASCVVLFSREPSFQFLGCHCILVKKKTDTLQSFMSSSSASVGSARHVLFTDMSSVIILLVNIIYKQNRKCFGHTPAHYDIFDNPTRRQPSTRRVRRHRPRVKAPPRDLEKLFAARCFRPVTTADLHHRLASADCGEAPNLRERASPPAGRRRKGIRVEGRKREEA